MKNITQNNNQSQVDRYPCSQIETEFGIGITAFKSRMLAANIRPFREGRTPYLSAEQVEILRRQHEYLLEPGATLKSYQEVYGVSDSSATDTSLANLENDSSSYVNMIIGDQESDEIIYSEYDEFMRNARDEILMNPRLRAYAIFKTYCLLMKTISDRECKEVIGWKPPRTGFTEGSYRFTRIGKSHEFNPETGKLEQQALWKIDKIDLDHELLLRQGRKRQKKLAKKLANATSDEEIEGLVNFNNGIKELFQS
jgi:hypothetical protein